MNKLGVERHRPLAVAALCVALAAPLACGPRSPAEGAEAGRCQVTPWGGWDGTPQCAGLAATLIASEHRGCNVDQDCVLVGAGPCEARTVNQAAAQRYQQLPPPCSHPLSGMCQPAQLRPVCQQGCCVVMRF